MSADRAGAPPPTAELGRTGMQITRIGFGAWAVGGDWQSGWGPQDDRESVGAIERALELGINWIDTAGVYGYGHSEEVVGRAIAGAGEKPLVFTKCGLIKDEAGQEMACLRRDSIRREAEASLARLGVEKIDLYQIHWPMPEAEIEEGWAALLELRDEGLVAHVGVSNFSVEQIRRVAGTGPVETLQPPYSLVAPSAGEEILPFCEDEGIGVIVYSPMGSGLLAGWMTRERIASLPDTDWRKSAESFNEPELSANLEIAARVGRVAEAHGVPAGAVAVAWTLRNPAVDAAIVGFRSARQVEDLIIGAGLALSDADAAYLGKDS
ncbi:MAG TPA: aldo/keto reductase [Solirubrobacterales bacterium]|nr:aldo/keto reductase [Solirubrobacterales bacterium]